VAASILALFVVAFAVFIPLDISDAHFTDRHAVLGDIISAQVEAVAFAGVLLFLILRHFHVGLSVLGVRAVPFRALAIGIAGWLLSLVLATLASWLVSLVFPNVDQSNVKETFGPLHQLGFLQNALLIFAFAVEIPLIEETVFRGVAYAGMKRFFTQRTGHHRAIALAAVISAALFGAAHFEPQSFAALFVMGIVLAYTYEYSGSVYISALAHGLNNALAFVSYVAVIHLT
jgi:membrane protease YdiL (CAAX protease family)